MVQKYWILNTFEYNRFFQLLKFAYGVTQGFVDSYQFSPVNWPSIHTYNYICYVLTVIASYTLDTVAMYGLLADSQTTTLCLKVFVIIHHFAIQDWKFNIFAIWHCCVLVTNLGCFFGTSKPRAYTAKERSLFFTLASYPWAATLHWVCLCRHTCA